MITGASGFLGQYIVRRLENLGCQSIFTPSHQAYDLCQIDAVKALFDIHPHLDLVIHAAATVGGIGFNQTHPATLFYNNLMMGTLLMEQARLAGARKFVGIGTVCSYPKILSIPFQETEFWNGYPEETNAPYGLAKKMLMVQSKAYRQQYGFNSIVVVPTNLYGPEDHWEPIRSHVIPALILKFLIAKSENAPTVKVWGTGNASREFLFVTDAVEGILKAAVHYNDSEPLNLGSGEEIRMQDLAQRMGQKIGYTGHIEWDTQQPDGQPRRLVDHQRAKELIGFKPRVYFDEGLDRTIRWFESRYNKERLNVQPQLT